MPSSGWGWLGFVVFGGGFGVGFGFVLWLLVGFGFVLWLLVVLILVCVLPLFLFFFCCWSRLDPVPPVLLRGRGLRSHQVRLPLFFAFVSLLLAGFRCLGSRLLLV